MTVIYLLLSFCQADIGVEFFFFIGNISFFFSLNLTKPKYGLWLIVAWWKWWKLGHSWTNMARQRVLGILRAPCILQFFFLKKINKSFNLLTCKLVFPYKRVNFTFSCWSLHTRILKFQISNVQVIKFWCVTTITKCIPSHSRNNFYLILTLYIHARRHTHDGILIISLT